MPCATRPCLSMLVTVQLAPTAVPLEVELPLPSVYWRLVVTPNLGPLFFIPHLMELLKKKPWDISTLLVVVFSLVQATLSKDPL